MKGSDRAVTAGSGGGIHAAPDSPKVSASSLGKVVALLEDLPQHGLVRGQVGTVVDQLRPGVWEVEFSDHNGRSYASLGIAGAQLLVLHHDTVETYGN